MSSSFLNNIIFILTVILPRLSMIFQEGVWSCSPIEYSVSHTTVGIASITERMQR